MNRLQWKAAFDLWNECLKVHPGNPLCSSGLGDLEKLAEQYLEAATQQQRAGNEAAAQDLLRSILGITRVDSLLHQKVRKSLKSAQ